MTEIVTDKKRLKEEILPFYKFEREEVLHAMQALEVAYKERPGCQLLAARQLDLDMDLALMKLPGKTNCMFVTDVRIRKDGPIKTSSEGSYSHKGRYHVKRNTRVIASYTRLYPNEDFTGYESKNIDEEKVDNVNVARIFQHLVDFNNGRLLSETGKLYALVDKAKKGQFEDW